MKPERISLGLRLRLRTWMELRQRALFEALLFSRLLWLLALALRSLLDRTGKKQWATYLGAQGQRSCPLLDIRTRFGGHAAARAETVAAYELTRVSTEPKLIMSRTKVLKPFVGARERGVLHIMYSEVISGITQLVDVRKFAPYYRLVIEPSWAGYADAGPMRYAGCGTDVVVMCPDAGDYDFIKRVGRGLVPTRLGAGDWVDPRIAEPYLDMPKDYDILVNANWAPWKRHHVLFEALSGASRQYKVALIGGALDGATVERMHRLANYYGVAGQVDTFEKVPFERVMSIVARARCSLLLSLKEGANRALPESMFCNVPVLALKRNVGGVAKNIVPETGLVIDDGQLLEAIDFLVSAPACLKPRQWATENISCVVSTAKLNSQLREIALAQGENWSEDIAIRCNSPESRYYSSDAETRLQAANQAVLEFLAHKRPEPI